MAIPRAIKAHAVTKLDAPKGRHARTKGVSFLERRAAAASGRRSARARSALLDSARRRAGRVVSPCRRLRAVPYPSRPRTAPAVARPTPAAPIVGGGGGERARGRRPPRDKRLLPPALSLSPSRSPFFLPTNPPSSPPHPPKTPNPPQTAPPQGPQARARAHPRGRGPRAVREAPDRAAQGRQGQARAQGGQGQARDAPAREEEARGDVRGAAQDAEQGQVKGGEKNTQKERERNGASRKRPPLFMGRLLARGAAADRGATGVAALSPPPPQARRRCKKIPGRKIGIVSLSIYLSLVCARRKSLWGNAWQ